MKFRADTLVSNLTLCSHNLPQPTRPVSTLLVLGREGQGRISLVLYSSQNKIGSKYRLHKDNIARVFCKFLDEGKTTLRFTEPQHDVSISKCDPIVLKSFLKVVKGICMSKDLKDIVFSDISKPPSSKQISKPKTRLVITNKKDYPITQNFPHTLERLEVTEINLKRFDSRILKLSHLTSLNLSRNAIAAIPTEIGKLKNLQELRLAGNLLEELPRNLFSGPISKSLGLLDLSKNKFKMIPNSVEHMKSLHTFLLGNNRLTRLPFTLGKVKSLRYLSACHNLLETLPGSLATRCLESLDLSGNPLKTQEDIKETIVRNNLQFPSLEDLTMIFCLKIGLRPSLEQISARLKVYMDSFNICQCGKICLSNNAVILVSMAFSKMTREIVTSKGERFGIFEIVVCSTNCLEKFTKNPFIV